MKEAPALIAPVFARSRRLVRQWQARIDSELDALAALPPPPVFLTLRQKLAISIAIQSATCVSIALHLFILFGIGFQFFDPRQFDPPHNTMDVVLVNAKSQTRPHDAKVLAQANLDGGGNTDENRRAKTPLPAIEQRAAKSELDAAQEKVRELEAELKALMTQARSTASVAHTPTAATGAPSAASELLKQSVEIEKLEAELNRQYEQYQQRPRRRFVGARVAEYRFANYIENWRVKVERVGNLNYPEELKQRRIRGNVQVTVAIKANGEVESIEITRGRHPKVLEETVRRIIRLAAPFDRFPDNIRRDTDVLHITRTWMFTKADTLDTQ